eukprot:GFYU01016709.1.p1 GENE.GFYU01016709.1~~GFYU01016709.1.p1  ORF type:complete len:218 (-),score=21.62 GFYU01016709.1:349-1002(-)
MPKAAKIKKIAGGAGRHNPMPTPKPKPNPTKKKVDKRDAKYGDQRFYTSYWTPYLREHYGDSPQGFNTVGGNQMGMHHSILREGDVYYPTFVKKNEMYIVGKFVVKTVIPGGTLELEEIAEWEMMHGLSRGFTRGNLIEWDTSQTVQGPTDGCVLTEMETYQLEWIRPDTTLRDVSRNDAGNIIAQGLQGVYRLHPESAAILDEAINRALEEERGGP